MSLFTDNNIATVDQMLAMDGEVSSLSAAAKASSPLNADAAVLTAWTEAAQQILTETQSYGGQWSSSFYGGNFPLGVWNSGNSPEYRLSNIVANLWDYPGAQSPIETWLLYFALSVFFRNAALRQDKADRITRKATMYTVERKSAWTRVARQGIPIVYQPIPCPGALHEPNAGAWNSQNVTVTGTAGVDAAYDIAITWVGSGSLVGNLHSESGPSARQSVQAATGQTITASILSLNPPTGNYAAQSGYASGITAGQTAIGWNVYAGPQGGTLIRQNLLPLAFSATSYDLTSITAVGPVMTSGQVPDKSVPVLRHIGRS